MSFRVSEYLDNAKESICLRKKIRKKVKKETMHSIAMHRLHSIPLSAILSIFLFPTKLINFI